MDTTGYTSDMLLLSQQIEQLKTSISSSKNAQTNYYNNIDDFTRILLDPNSTLQQRQLAINTIISNTNSTSTINVLNKTYNDLPDKTIIDTSILELQNKQILFPQVKQQWYDKYKNFEQEYLQKKQDYDSYMVYISNYGEILKEYNYVFNQIQSL
ncbi:MAG: hypothetical protein Q8S84_05180 [bacterium]|nr:hypothetical protein [bacterium]